METALSRELNGQYLTHFMRMVAPGIKRWLRFVCVRESVNEGGRWGMCVCAPHKFFISTMNGSLSLNRR